jgi:hypothetical protein
VDRYPADPRPTTVEPICVVRYVVDTKVARFAVDTKLVRFAVDIKFARFAVEICPDKLAVLIIEPHTIVDR